MHMTENKNSLAAEALELHARGRAGKIEIKATKPLNDKRDLALAYSPGVAAPCLEIEKNPDDAYLYTAKGIWSPSCRTEPRFWGWATSDRRRPNP